MAGGLCSIGELQWEYINKDESEFLYREVFERRTYLRGGISLCDGDIVVDVGANIGLFSLFCCREAKDLKIVAVEPIPDIAAVLRRNLLSSSSSNEVIVLNCAAGFPAEEGCKKDTFTYYRSCPGESTRRADERDCRQLELLRAASSDCEHSEIARGVLLAAAGSDDAVSYSCPVISVEDVFSMINLPCIDLLKIDVEGDELDVLLGVKDCWYKIRQVVVEVYDTQDRLRLVIDLLQSQGFSVTSTQQLSEVLEDGYMMFIPPTLRMHMVYAYRR